MVSNPNPKLPRGLFARVIKRLGLEQEIAVVRRHLGFFGFSFLFLAVVMLFATIGLRTVLAESNFGSYLSLLISNPSLLFKYWHSLGLSLLESFPAVDGLLVIIVVAFLMLCARLISTARHQWSVLGSAIRKQRYGNR